MAKAKAAPKVEVSQGEVATTTPDDSVYIGKSTKPEFIYLRLANRHGLITGATGTGKTVTPAGFGGGIFRPWRSGLLRRCEKRPFGSSRARATDGAS